MREPWTPWPDKIKTVKSSLVALAMPVLVLGLIYTGTVYVTEAAGIAVLYVLVACLIEGTIKWRDLIGILRESAKMTTMLFMMIIGSVVLGGMVSVLGFTEKIVEGVLAMNVSANMVVFLIMVSSIILGTYLEPSAIMFLFVPMAAPLLKSLGVDLVWFGVMYAINMEMAIDLAACRDEHECGATDFGCKLYRSQQRSYSLYCRYGSGLDSYGFFPATVLVASELADEVRDVSAVKN